MKNNLNKLFKNCYKKELEKITIPESPFPVKKEKQHRAAEFILSFALTVGSLLFIVSGFSAKPSLLAEHISVFSEHYKLDEVIFDGIDNLKTGYNLIFKED